MRRVVAGVCLLVCWGALTGFKAKNEDLVNAFGWGYGDAAVAGAQSQNLAIKSAQMSLSVFLSARPIPFSYERVKGVPNVEIKFSGKSVPDSGVTVQEVPGGVLSRADWQRSESDMAALRPFDMKRASLKTPWTADGIPWRDAVHTLVDQFVRPCKACRIEGVVLLVNSDVDLKGRELHVELMGHVKVGTKKNLNREDQIAALLKAGRRFARERRWPDALDALKKATTLSSKNVLAYSELARVAWQAGVVEGAKKATQKLIKLEPKNSRWARDLALLNAGRTWDQAQELVFRDRLKSLEGPTPNWTIKSGWIEKNADGETWFGVGFFKLPKSASELSMSQLKLSISVAHNRARGELSKLDNVTVTSNKKGIKTWSASTLTGVRISEEHLAKDGRTFWALATMQRKK